MRRSARCGYGCGRAWVNGIVGWPGDVGVALLASARAIRGVEGLRRGYLKGCYFVGGLRAAFG